MSSNTERTFSEAAEERRLHRPAKGTALFNRAMKRANACRAATALKWGVSSSLVQKFEEGRGQLGLHDQADLATSNRDLFVAMLIELAALADMTVVDAKGSGTQADRLASAARCAKEAGEAVGAIVSAAAMNDPRADEVVIREGEEAISVLSSEVAAAKVRKANHYESIARRTTPRHSTNRC